MCFHREVAVVALANHELYWNRRREDLCVPHRSLMDEERELAEGEEEPEFDSDEDIGVTGGDLSLFWTLNRERAQAGRGDDVGDEVLPLVYNVYAGSVVHSFAGE